jgi:hypothetical protein
MSQETSCEGKRREAVVEIGNACPGHWAPCDAEGRCEQRVIGEHESAGVVLRATRVSATGGQSSTLHVCRHCRCVYWEGA